MSEQLEKFNGQLSNLESIQKVAQGMLDFIKQTKLSIPIQNKQYIQVDGWQFLSISLNLTPIITELQNLSNESEFKYQAKCELKNAANELVSVGFGICSNKEMKKRQFDEYAICSMAQTRAIGRAYRNRFGFIAKVAGFEPTPLEEMDEVFKEVSNNKPQNPQNESNKSIDELRKECYQVLKTKKEKLSEISYTQWIDNIERATVEKTLLQIKKDLAKLKNINDKGNI